MIGTMAYLTDFIIDLGITGYNITAKMSEFCPHICPMIKSDELSISKLDAWDQ